eukprot:8846279-Pyramimonas_sp.AAC.1
MDKTCRRLITVRRTGMETVRLSYLALHHRHAGVGGAQIDTDDRSAAKTEKTRNRYKFFKCRMCT